MTTQHTPGPWKSDSPYNMSFIWGQDGEPIAQLWDKQENIFRNEKETEANARLIASAPELLDALIKAEKYIRENNHSDFFKESETGKLIIEAIKKATSQ